MAVQIDLKKPPLGLIPRHIRDIERLKEIADALQRYVAHPAVIPVEWIEEYNDIVVRIDKTKDIFGKNIPSYLQRVFLDENLVVFQSDHSSFKIGRMMDETKLKSAAHWGFSILIIKRGK